MVVVCFLFLNFPLQWLPVSTYPSAFQFLRGCCLLSAPLIFVGLCFLPKGGKKSLLCSFCWVSRRVKMLKRRLLLGRKVMTNLDSIFKSRDITLPTKVHLVKAMVFLVVMYGCESWTIKKTEGQRIDAFELWCWRRLLRVPWMQGDPTSPS